MSIVGKAPHSTNDTLFVVDSDRPVPLVEAKLIQESPALSSLIQQEVHRNGRARTSERVSGLLERFGFDWEAVTEPGHMRFGPAATFVTAAAARYAEARARSIADALDLPFDVVDGVKLVDAAAPALRDYLTLISAAPELYGRESYELQSPHETLQLRQTGCLQKFLMLQHWGSDSVLPRCIYELSNSFRGEPVGDLELCFRLRHFRLPEAHVHARSLIESVAQARVVHRAIVDDLTPVVGRLAMLISTTAEFAATYEDMIVDLTRDAESPALLCVSPPGVACQDGVELDVEYKFADSEGFARELSTFQIDERIGRAFGLGTRDVPLTTIHCVPIGSVERFVFAAFDRIARLEAAGGSPRLPLWMSPTVVRIVLPPDGNPGIADVAEIVATLAGNGVRVDVDDRPIGVAAKSADARADLVPVQIHVSDADATAADALHVTKFESPAARGEPMSLACLVDQLMAAPDFTESPRLHRPRRLSEIPQRLSQRDVQAGR
jgi:threonyl-tRNA synthetase